jgi:hypothetical protein
MRGGSQRNEEMIHVRATIWDETFDPAPEAAKWRLQYGRVLCGAKPSPLWMPIPGSGPPMREYVVSGASGWHYYRRTPFCFECLWAFFMPEAEGEG